MFHRNLIALLFFCLIATPAVVFAQSKTDEAAKSGTTTETTKAGDETKPAEGDKPAEPVLTEEEAAAKKAEEDAAAEKAAAEKAAAEKAAAEKAAAEQAAAKRAAAEQAAAEQAAAEKAAIEKAAADKAAAAKAVALIPIDYNVHTEDADWQHYAIWAPLNVLAVNTLFWQISLKGGNGADFAKISARNLEKNFLEGWHFDDNEFEVNQFAHPYQGGLYFLGARVNNMGFWSSTLYTVLGSWQWEVMMETESPATNDLWMTVFGGWYMGEVMYRMSNLLLDDTATGADRSWREVGAGVLAPLSGLDRLYTGETSQQGPAPIKHETEVQLRFGIAGIPLDEGPSDDEWSPTWKALIHLDYGDFYKKEVTKTPYEQFDFEAGLLWNFREESIFGAQFDGNGTWYGWRLGENKSMFFGFIQNYEFFTNATAKILQRDATGTYQLGQTSVGPFFKSTWPLGRLSLDLEIKALPIIMGAVTSPYAVEVVNRTYQYGPGFTGRVALELRDRRWGYLKSEVRRYYIRVLDGVDGNEFTGLWNNELFFNIYGGHGILAAALLYDRESLYDEPDKYPDIIEHFWTGRLMYQKVW